MGFAKYRQHAPASFVIAALCSIGSTFSVTQLLPADPRSSQTGQLPAPPPSLSDQNRPGLLIPQDPKEMLLAAAQVNSLDAPGLKPWHILVSYEKFDIDGDNVDSGTYEEYWAGPKQYRLSYTSHDFTQTDIATDKGLYRSGAAKWPGELQTMLRDEFVRPMFREMNLLYAKPEKKMRDFGEAKVPCVLLHRSDTGEMVVPESQLAAFCFEPDSLILRYSKGGMSRITVWEQNIYDNIVRFQGRYVASDVQVSRGGKLFLKMHLEKLESIAQLSTADFTPPSSAVPIEEQLVTVDNLVMMLDYLLHEERLQLPNSLHSPGGQAVVKYVIGKAGRVTTVQFVEGTPEMQKVLDAALKKYEYRVFIVRGEPVDVQVTQKYVFGH